MTANELLRDRVIEHAVYLERYTKRELIEVLAILEKANDSVIEKIAAASIDISENGKQALLDEIRRAYAAAVEEMKRRFTDQGRALAQQELDFVLSILKETPIEASFAMLTAQQLWAAVTTSPTSGGYIFDELFRAFDEGTQQKIISAIRQGFVEGESIPEIVRRLRGSRASHYTDGVMQASRRGAEALVRTIVNHIANTAALETYRANSDLVKQIEWLATLDRATCPICGALDGTTWPTEDSHALPPAHPGCRCAITPVLASWKALGIENPPGSVRASMNGEVPGATTYEEWLRRQGAAFQDEVLGPSRGAMLRAGKPLDSMIDRGKLLTLEELGAKSKGRAA